MKILQLKNGIAVVDPTPIFSKYVEEARLTVYKHSNVVLVPLECNITKQMLKEWEETYGKVRNNQ